MLPVLLLSFAEAGFNQLLTLDPSAREHLPLLADKPLAIELAPFNWRLVLRVEGQRLRFASDGEAVLTLSGRMQDFAEAALAGGELTAGVLQVRGSVGAAQLWQQFFQSLQPDFEEKLAGLIGDIPAHQLGKLLRGTARQLGHWLASFKQAGVEYLQEESRMLVTRDELGEFLDGVDQLRMDADRLLQLAARRGYAL